MRWYNCENYSTKYGIEYANDGTVEKIEESFDGEATDKIYTRNPKQQEELLSDMALRVIFKEIIRCGDDDATRELVRKVKGHDAKVLSDALCAEVERCVRAIKMLNKNS